MGDDCVFWDWGYSDSQYPSKRNPGEMDFSGTAYSEMVKNLVKGCYDVNGKCKIYIVILPVTDRKDKHNIWKNSYSPRVDVENIDSTYLMKLNEGVDFDPSQISI